MKSENDIAIKELWAVSDYARVCGEDEYFHYCEFQKYIKEKIKRLEEKERKDAGKCKGNDWSNHDLLFPW